jgi:hypothetical protein
MEGLTYHTTVLVQFVPSVSKLSADQIWTSPPDVKVYPLWSVFCFSLSNQNIGGLPGSTSHGHAQQKGQE